MTHLKIEVTERDIAAGVRCDCMACPVALAIQRAITHGGNRHHRMFAVSVNVYNISVLQHGNAVRVISADTPAEVREFILGFDGVKRRTFHPFTFQLPIDWL